jgi:hypothetical protein
VRAVASVLVCLLAAVGNASAAPPPPMDLDVDGGEERWHPKRSFRILWSNPVTKPPIAAVHYRVRDPSGTVVVGPVRLPWAANDVDGIEVPPQPAAYLAEVSLEDAAGQRSGFASATLRFDDRRPGQTAPLMAPGWVGRAAFPLAVRLSRPAQVPLSGIRGYAVSASSDPDRPPCAAAERCTEAETDLRGGVEGDAYAVSDLPEGTGYLRAVAVSGSGVASVASAPLTLRVDKTYPTTTLRGAPAGWTKRPVELTATARDDGSGMLWDEGGAQPFTAISIDGATPVTAPGPVAKATIVAEGAHRVAYYARDLAGNVDDGRAENGTVNPASRTALVRVDRTPPRVSFANAQDREDPELIRARIVDPLSGPAGDRGWIGVRRRGSGDPFAALTTMPGGAGELLARWSSEAHPDGEYEFRAVGFDRAGNSAATRLRGDGSPMILANPLKERTTLRAVLLGEARGDPPATSRLAVPFGRAAVVRGRLLAGARALGSRSVQVVERLGGAGEGTRVSTVVTAADGRFSLRLPPGPSREVSAAFAGDRALTKAASPALSLAVRGEVRMRTSARSARVGGAPLLFAGRVSAAPGTIPVEGKVVELQFRLRGQPWTEFRTIRTDRRGRFRYRYRFSDDDSRGVRFLFRAYAPAQAGWPYEPSGSRPLAVRGR